MIMLNKGEQRNMMKEKRKKLCWVLLLFSLGLVLSACGGGGDSGGSSSGSGSSTVQGRVVSLEVAMDRAGEKQSYYFADFIASLLPVQSALADGGVDGIRVEIGQARTNTDGNGNFQLNGIAPGTHQVMFTKNGQTASTMVTVGENEVVTMENIRMNGSQIHVQSVTHMSTGGGNQGSPGMQ